MWHIFLVISIICLYIFLVSPKLIGRNSLKHYGRYFAHRGLHDENTPENSLAAFIKAAEKGYGIELDVNLSKDNVPVVFHDYSLERLCGIKGKVKDYTYDELSRFKLSGTDESIPSLDYVLTLLEGKAEFLIELKTISSYTLLCEKTAEVLKRHNGKFVVQSFNPFMLKWFRKNMPSIPRGQLISRHLISGGIARSTAACIVASLTLNFASRPDFICIHHENINTYIHIIPKLFLSPFAFWTVENRNDAERLEKKGKIIIFEGFEP